MQPSAAGRLQKILANKYNKEEQVLDLYSQVEDWRNVLMCQNWAKLRTLNLACCRIEESGAELVGNLQWPNLQTLQIWNNKLSAVEIYHIFVGEIPNTKMNHLAELYLDGNNIGSKGIKILVKAELLLLKKLWLSQCRLGDSGAKQLTKGSWPELAQMQLNENAILLDGYSGIVNGDWKNLKQIGICSFAGPVDILNFVATNWPYQSLMICGFCSYMEEQANDILMLRFSQE